MRFKNGRTSVDSDPRSGQPSLTTTLENIECVRLVIHFMKFRHCNSTGVHACITLMKKCFLLFQMEAFFLDFFAQLGQ